MYITFISFYFDVAHMLYLGVWGKRDFYSDYIYTAMMYVRFDFPHDCAINTYIHRRNNGQHCEIRYIPWECPKQPR